jgi:hypothetical protein
MQKAGVMKTGTSVPGPALKLPIMYTKIHRTVITNPPTSKPGPLGIQSLAPAYKKYRRLLSISADRKIQILQQSG